MDVSGCRLWPVRVLFSQTFSFSLVSVLFVFVFLGSLFFLFCEDSLLPAFLLGSMATPNTMGF